MMSQHQPVPLYCPQKHQPQHQHLLSPRNLKRLEPLIRGRVIGTAPLSEITENWGGFWRKLTSNSQLRWLGPEKGVVHLATAAVVVPYCPGNEPLACWLFANQASPLPIA